ncbi:hypothetical protein ACER0A_008765 [Haloimpatiens sp. FM7315]|uniref:hypothetical protein n=1 Tax=Haloimpatiens sp. FM7315 TaxID=3298609 RepID=UPI0035A2A96D
MIETKIIIKNITLDFVTFTLEPEINSISKSQLRLLLNNAAFNNYILLIDSSTPIIVYKILPYSPFNTSDLLNMKILDESIVSTTVEIFFCIFVSKGTVNIPFTLTEVKEGKCIFTINIVNSETTNISSYPLMLIYPIDYNASDIWTESPAYYSNELFNVDFKILTEGDTPIPDGYYEIEIV